MPASKGPGSTRKRILIVSGVWPHFRANLEAANVICFEIIRNLLKHDALDVGFCLVSPRIPEPPPEARSDIEMLERAGLQVLSPVLVPTPKPRGLAQRVLANVVATPELVLVGASGADELEARASTWQADLVMPIWSEMATAACLRLSARKFAYYGNPDHKALAAQVHFAWERSPLRLAPLVRYLRGIVAVTTLRRAHLKLMRSFDAVGDVALNDAEFYKSHGVRGALYIRNMWPNERLRDWATYRRIHEQVSPAKITANVGNLSATGNTLGLDLLGREILPALKRRLGAGTFELHLFGGREPHPLVANSLRDPHVHLRGFVKDLDAEILSSPLFLISNNYRYFKVGHTRFLHAWSLGACVIAFRDCAEAMPELVHRENVLLADNVNELAELASQALADRALRERLARGGQRALRESFSPESICDLIVTITREILESGEASLPTRVSPRPRENIV